MYSNFYFHGKKHFTKTGYETNVASYKEPKFLDDLTAESLKTKVYLVTGANQGIGKEVATFLAKKGGTVFMACRSAERAQKACQEIITESGNENVIVLQADVSLEADVRRMWRDFLAHPLAKPCGQPAPQLHGLVCNAGALLNTRTLTAEGVETTFACHLLFGTYLLGELAMPTLERTPGSRMVVVSSGGMYNTALPSWEVLSGTHESSEAKYSGDMAYAYAKRAQVLIAEYWAASATRVKVVTVHPGWTLTDGVEKAFGEKKSWLEPLRSTWEGAEGICWLCAVKAGDIVTGSFYLDREPQAKHIAGLFCTEGSATKNTPQEIEMFYENLERWAPAVPPGTVGPDGRPAPLKVWRPTPERTAAKIQSRLDHPVALPSAVPFNLDEFMIKWHVLANIPLFISGEHLLCNGYEHYQYDKDRKMVKVRFTSTPLGSQESQLALMHGHVKNPPTNTDWSLNPKLLFYLPLNLGYIMLYVAPDMSWCLVGTPSRANMWIMTAKRPTTKDPKPWPAGVQSSTYRFQMGCTSGGYGDVISCELQDLVTPVFKGTGTDYSDQRSEMLSAEEEDHIVTEGLLKAEASGFDISEVRFSGWRVDIP